MQETLAGDPQAGEHTRDLAMHMAEQLAAVEGLLEPMAAAKSVTVTLQLRPRAELEAVRWHRPLTTLTGHCGLPEAAIHSRSTCNLRLLNHLVRAQQ